MRYNFNDQEIAFSFDLTSEEKRFAKTPLTDGEKAEFEAEMAELRPYMSK